MSLGKLNSGEEVVDHCGSHLHNGLSDLLPRALEMIQSNGRQFIVEEVDFGQPIGESICVATEPGDQIIFARRPKRLGHSRFVLNRKPESCSSLVVILKKAEDNSYICITAFVGHTAEPEPWDSNATEQSEAFWSNHALIWGQEETIPGSKIVKCPWKSRA